MRGDKIPMDRGNGWKYPYYQKKSVNDAGPRQGHTNMLDKLYVNFGCEIVLLALDCLN